MKLIIAILTILFCSNVILAGEIGFDEQFSLAEDRTTPLKELIAGTEDYYYYHCVHYQNIGEYKKVDEILQNWIKRYGYTQRVKEIQNRQAVLKYSMSPQESLEYIRRELNLNFLHQKKQLQQKKDYPSSLNQELISTQTLKNLAFQEYEDLTGFEDCFLENILREPLTPTQRKDLLKRLTRPVGKNLVQLIIDDLNDENSEGFGSHFIHRQLLIEQLDACAKLMPSLLNQPSFVEIYISKLQPNADTDWINNPIEKEAYIKRMWEFAKKLSPIFNSLKAHILYHWLDFSRKQGSYLKDKFMEYIRLPRSVSYMKADYLNKRENREYRVDLNADYSSFTSFPAIGNDEPLVRDYLQYLLIDEESFDNYAEFIDYNYLKKIFAETKILYGKGNIEQWFSYLGDSVQALKERVEIDFLPTNQDKIKANQLIKLDVAIKNVPKLMIKIYRINTFSYYKQKMEEITPAIDLDGLVPNEEKIVEYNYIELRRHKESFEFPQLDKPGVYVIELIGNGKSSRALIRKGKLSFTVRTGSAGHVFTVYDDNNEKIPDAKIWLAGHEYLPDKDGEITIPFTNTPGKQKIIIIHKDFAVLGSFMHESENYTLKANFYVDKESLIAGQIATLTVKANLTVNENPIDLGLLIEPVLTISTTDIDGIRSSKEIRNLKLFNDKDLVCTFRVPERITEISFNLKGKVENLSQGKKDDLSVSSSIKLNNILKTNKIEDFHLISDKTKYFIEVVGRNAEPKPDRPLYLEIKNRFFKRTISIALKTNQNGTVELGELKDIEWLLVKNAEGTTKKFVLTHDKRSYPNIVHGLAGSKILIPTMTNEDLEISELISLLEKRGEYYIQDYTHLVSFKNGFIEIKNLPPGDFEAFLKKDGVVITIRIAKGKEVNSYFISSKRYLQVQNINPVQITRVYLDESSNNFNIQLENVTPSTRVHVVATRFVPNSTIFDSIGQIIIPEPFAIPQSYPISQYLSGRNLGDEFRYILERKYARIYPGNMLRQPSLLLNPWSLRKTDTQIDRAAKGDLWTGGSESEETYQPPQISTKPRLQGNIEGSEFSCFDFLENPAVVLSNLKPDKTGKIVLSKEIFQDKHYLQILAVDLHNSVYRKFSLPQTAPKFRDLRLVRALEPSIHFSEQKKISIVQAKASFQIEDISTAKIETYDSLASVYNLFCALTNDTTLAEFGFILEWPQMSLEKKQELYSKYACHELNFFLYKKDPEFFQNVIKPYITNKKDKTFLDRWLLEDSLTDFLLPWAYNRLNIVEKILLAKRVKGQMPSIIRHITDLFNLIPPNIEKSMQLFDTALKSASLETEDRFGFTKEQKKASITPAPGPTKTQETHLIGVPTAPPPPSPMKSTATKDRFKKPSFKREFSKMAFEEAIKSMDLMELSDSSEFTTDSARRSKSRQFFKQLEKTEEWLENNYYHLPIEQQTGDLVKVNGFWLDFAVAQPDKPFLSTNVAEASNNFTEMMFALAVLDLPFKPTNHNTQFKNGKMVLQPTYDIILFHKEIKQSEVEEKNQTILTNQNFFAQDERYRFVDNEQFDKFVTDEFQTHRVYGCQVVLTNTTSARKKTEVLIQIPKGSIPVLSSFYTRSMPITLEPFTTKTIEYYFYFPQAGTYEHYPVHVSENGKVIAYTTPFVFNVVDRLTKIDTTSWEYISQHATNEEVLQFLDQTNILRLDLEQIAWRMKDKEMFLRVIELLNSRHVYNDTIWSYGLYHNYPPAIKEFLKHSTFANNCGSNIESPILTIEPVSRHVYQHKEYWPLVNARVYQLGRKRKILNEQFYQQYMKLMADLRYRAKLTDNDRIAVTYYLLLQNRIEEAQKFFNQIKDETLIRTIQYDYMKCFFAFYNEKPQEALEIATRYKEYPVDRWRKLFNDVIAQVAEIKGEKYNIVDNEDRTQTQTKLADTSPHFEFKIEDRKIYLNYHNLKACKINYYLMDIELLFSRNPFVQEVTDQFSIIHPNESIEIFLPEDKDHLVISIPPQFNDKNVMIEIVGGGLTKSQPYYPHSLGIQIMENYGQLKITDINNREPISKAYIKVYARTKNGNINFYKDGYTDLRGRFDYASLSTNDLDNVDKFAILIMSDKNGAVVREANPPKQ